MDLPSPVDLHFSHVGPDSSAAITTFVRTEVYERVWDRPTQPIEMERCIFISALVDLWRQLASPESL